MFSNLTSPSVPLDPSEFEFLCRVCLKRGHLQSIFYYNESSLTEPRDISDTMRLCSGLSIEISDQLPNKICEECYALLATALHFRTLCENSEKIIRTAFKNYNQEALKFEQQEAIIDNVSSNTGQDVKVELSDESASDSSDNVEEVSRVNDDEDCSDGFYWESSDFYYCLVCGAEFTDKDSVKRHTQTEHLKVKKNGFKCYGCNKVFKSRWDRELHEDMDCPLMPPGTKYVCRVCSVETTDRSDFDIHLAAHRGMSDSRPSKSRKKPRETSRMREPKSQPAPANVVHDIDALPEYVCELCGRILRMRAALRRHLLAHGARELLACDLCPYRGRGPAALRSHRRRHMRRRAHECATCGHRTDTPSEMLIHQRVHTGEKPFACVHCPYRAINIGNLKKHEETHLPRMHQCLECSKTYLCKTRLADHVASVHEGRMPYPCSVCPTGFTTRRAMRRHAKRFHLVTTGQEVTATGAPNPPAPDLPALGMPDLAASLGYEHHISL